MTTPRIRLVLLIAIAAVTICGTSIAQTLIGSSAAGWQTWTVTPISSDQPNLNDNGAPWWDLQWNAASTNGAYSGGYADKNPGFCMTATGDCVGIGSEGSRSRNTTILGHAVRYGPTRAAPGTTRFISGARAGD